jgi:hypothetical protein
MIKWRWIAGLTTLLFLTTAAQAAQERIVLKEHLNRQWKDEVVRYILVFKDGEYAEGSGRLLHNGKEIPFQLSKIITFRPGYRGKNSAALSFVVDNLAPRATETYTFQYSDKPGSGRNVPSALKVREEDGAIRITNGKGGVLIPIGKKYYKPSVAPEQVPVPLKNLITPDGKLIGGSSLYGTEQVISWSSEVVAQGPVRVAVRVKYGYTSGVSHTVSFTMTAVDSGVHVSNHASSMRGDNGWRISLNKGLPVDRAILIAGMGRYAREREKPITPTGKTPLCSLSAWQGDGWFKDNPGSVRLPFKGRKDELRVIMKKAGHWVHAHPRPKWADFRTWTYDMIPIMWKRWQVQMVPFEVGGDGNITLNLRHIGGARKFAIAMEPQSDNLIKRYRGKVMSVNSPLPRLDEVKDMVLAWRDKGQRHPYLFMTQREMQHAAGRNVGAYNQITNAKKLLHELDKLGDIDLMRDPKKIACLYDANIDAGRMTGDQREIAKAQFAYLAYTLQDPAHWSFERGMNSGNPNMVVSRILSLSLFGICMRGNPQGQKWVDYGKDWAEYWLDTVVDDQGYWTESSHYARVSWSYFILYAIASRNAGYTNFLKHPKFRLMSELYARMNTPPDPLRRAQSPRLRGNESPAARVDPPYGRGVRGDAYDYAGMLAKATHKTDPEFSARMQWVWKETGFVEFMAGKTMGLGSLYLDRHLPAKRPNWKSEHIRKLGYQLRSHIGSDLENYLLFVSQYYSVADGEIWPSNTGAIVKWFAHGAPIGGAFVRMYNNSHVLLENRVMLATNWDPKTMKPMPSGYVTKTKANAFAALDTLDYVDVDFVVPEIADHPITINPKAPAMPKRKAEGKTPLDWKRQFMLIKPRTPKGVNYMILRDTVRSKSPTQWHFWTLSEKIVPHQEPFRRGMFYKGGSNRSNAPATELKGDHFTAIGQFGVDTEYYIASPSNTPRYTARYGHRKSAYGIHSYHEYQDLMHLQLEGPGIYFVAMFPHKEGEIAPEFATLGKGTIIRIKGEFGTDYCFMSDKKVTAKGDKATFHGTSGSIQDRAGSLTITLASSGMVEYKGYRVRSAYPLTASITPTSITLSLADHSPYSSGNIALSVPGATSLSDAADGKEIPLLMPGQPKQFAVFKKEGVKTIRLVLER